MSAFGGHSVRAAERALLGVERTLIENARNEISRASGGDVLASMEVWAVGCSLLQIDADVSRKR
jgi:hypothetical protein